MVGRACRRSDAHVPWIGRGPYQRGASRFLSHPLCGGRTQRRNRRKDAHAARFRSDYPAVGDWIAYSQLDESHALVRGILPRATAVVRKAAGTAVDEQIIATNVDVLFLMSALDGDFNMRRIERYVSLAYDSGAQPVTVAVIGSSGVGKSTLVNRLLGADLRRTGALRESFCLCRRRCARRHAGHARNSSLATR